MAIHHAVSAELIDIRPLGSKLRDSKIAVLVNTDKLEVIGIVVPADKQLPSHWVDGEIAVQCLEGRIVFDVDGAERELGQGEMLYLTDGAMHAMRGIEDSSVLVTILLR